MKIVVACLALGMLALVGGCVDAGTPINEGAMYHFVIGQTTGTQVLHEMGQPMASSNGINGHALVYSYTHAQANAASFIPVVGLFVGGATATGTTVTFLFDDNGVLTNISRSGADVTSHY